jgi:hypothetical protein
MYEEGFDWISQESARYTIKNCTIRSFQGMSTGACGNMVEALGGCKPKGRGLESR